MILPVPLALRSCFNTLTEVDSGTCEGGAHVVTLLPTHHPGQEARRCAPKGTLPQMAAMRHGMPCSSCCPNPRGVPVDQDGSPWHCAASSTGFSPGTRR